VVPATLSCIAVIISIWRNSNLPQYFRSLAAGTTGLLVCQILLGVATFKLHLQVAPLTVIHQAIGAILLGMLVVLTVLLSQINRSVSIVRRSIPSDLQLDLNCHNLDVAAVKNIPHPYICKSFSIHL
jgi:heme A synthase